MHCCPGCFVDTEIKAIVSGLSDAKGKCDICGNVDTEVTAIEELSDYFSPILDLYEADDDASSNIHQVLNSDWHIFTNQDCSRRILGEMFSASPYNNLLNQNVRPNYIDDSNSADIWNDFTEEIKEKNRFFITNNLFVRNVIEKLLKYHTLTLRAGTKFYRGRICDTPSGLPVDKLGAPPQKKARPGRANPQGISYLYLAKSEETTLYEIRASFWITLLSENLN